MKTECRPVGELLEAMARQPKIKRSEYQDHGRFPIVDQSKADIAGYTDDPSWLYQGQLPVVIFGDHTRVLKFVDHPFCVGADGTQLLRPIAGNDIRYFYYALRNVHLTNYGYERHFKYLKQENIPVPPLPVQQRIAGILSAYDELIENSQRRIQILEAMARALYREWFVHFRFPGHENHLRVASPLGEIPKGWEASPFENLLLSMTGGDWGSEQPDGDDSAEVGIVRGTDFNEVAYGGDLRVPVRYIKPSSLKSRGLRVADVIVENSVNAKSRCIGTPLFVDAHVLARLGRDAVAASFCKVFRFHDTSLAPLAHLHLRHLREEKRMEYYQNVAANGIGNFQAQKFAKEEHLVIPANSQVRAEFVGNIAALLSGLSLLASNIQNLRRTRDLLLPRLLSGQIEVEAV